MSWWRRKLRAWRIRVIGRAVALSALVFLFSVSGASAATTKGIQELEGTLFRTSQPAVTSATTNYDYFLFTQDSKTYTLRDLGPDTTVTWPGHKTTLAQLDITAETWSGVKIAGHTDGLSIAVSTIRFPAAQKLVSENSQGGGHDPSHSTFVSELEGFLERWGSLLIGFGVIAILGAALAATRGMVRAHAGGEAKPEPSQTGGVRFEDVIGAEDAKEELAEVIEALRNPTRFKLLGARTPRGVLLTGDPGTGKTMFAKAIATEAGASFFARSGSDFVETFVGTGAKRIRALFKAARAHAPAIIFIDEADSVGGKRGGAHHDESDRTLNQLLVEMDGFTESDNVIVIAATNRVDMLDSALLRPGRFDRKIHVGPPDVAARKEILAVHTKNKPLADDVKIDHIARQTTSFVGANLANLCNEAAIHAGRAGRSQITQADFDSAYERILVGLGGSKTRHADETRLIAYHEAGHVVTGCLLDSISTPHRVTIAARGNAGGFVLDIPPEDRSLHTREEYENHLVMLLAGRAAEEVFIGQITPGAVSDLERATATATDMVNRFGFGDSLLVAEPNTDSDQMRWERDTERKLIVTAAKDKAVAILREHREQVEAVAQALLDRETLTRNEVDELMTANAPSASATQS